MICSCAAASGMEHRVSCPMYEPPLSQLELRGVRRLLAERVSDGDVGARIDRLERRNG